MGFCDSDLDSYLWSCRIGLFVFRKYFLKEKIMGAIFILLLPFMALIAPFEFIFETTPLFFEPFSEVIDEWMLYFGA